MRLWEFCRKILLTVIAGLTNVTGYALSFEWLKANKGRLIRAAIFAGLGTGALIVAVNWYGETRHAPLQPPSPISIELHGPQIDDLAVALSQGNVEVGVHTRAREDLNGTVALGRVVLKRFTIVTDSPKACMQQVEYIPVPNWGCTHPIPVDTTIAWTSNSQKTDAYLPTVTVCSTSSNQLQTLTTYLYEFQHASNYSWTTSPAPEAVTRGGPVWSEELVPVAGSRMTTWKTPPRGVITAIDQTEVTAAFHLTFEAGIVGGVAGGFFTAAVVALLEAKRETLKQQVDPRQQVLGSESGTPPDR